MAIRLWCRKFGPLLAGAHQLLATRPRDPKKLGPVELAEWLRNRVTITPQHLDDIPAAKRHVPGIFVVITVAAEPDAPMCDTVRASSDQPARLGLGSLQGGATLVVRGARITGYTFVLRREVRRPAAVGPTRGCGGLPGSAGGRGRVCQ